MIFKLLPVLLLFVLLIPCSCDAEYVKGYMRKDGTYVQGHYRSKANNSKWDNYSAKGNYNPYTGKTGKTSPYRKIKY
jgi:hypothetical protein